MPLDDIIGDIIFISFRNPDRLKEIGIEEDSGHFLLKGYDQMGLWIDHPGIIIKHMEDDKGHPLEPEKQSHEEIDAVFLVNWDNINTIMHYPDRTGYDFPNQYQKKNWFCF